MADLKKLPYVDKPDRWSSHTIIASWIEALPDGAAVLDLGTASGTLARMCQGKPLRWRGLEPNPDWAELARPFYEDFWISTIEEAPDEFLSGADAVVLADVLEHVSRPEQTLKRLVALQPDQAQFFISVPNIANLYIRLSLLAGKFEYTERGILDDTHLRFFTRSSFLNMIRSCGLEPVRLEATPIPLPLVHSFFENSVGGRFVYNSLARLTRILPTLLGYQFVVKARKVSH